MAKYQCAICGNDIGLFATKIEIMGGGFICSACATKAGVANYSRLPEISSSMIREWIEVLGTRVAYFEERKRKEAEKKRLAAEKYWEEERRRKEQAAAEREEALQREREMFPEGRVHATIVQVSFTEIGAAFGKGNILDTQLQILQNRGCNIMNVTCYA